MRKILHSFFFLSFLLLCSSKADVEKAKAVNLKCEYLINPLGIDEAHPRFTWQLYDERQGAEQKAFRIILGTDSSAVSKGAGNVWDSGKMSSGQVLIRYGGDMLKPFTRYYWGVELWNESGKKTDDISVASFETGMMKKGNWKGSWISDTRDISLKPAPYFRKSFTVKGKVKSARQYIAVAGLYELYINGKKSGNSRLDPAYTRFDRRTLYVTHDVTPYIHEGKNTIGVLLGNGWYNHQSTAVWYFHEAPWRARPSFCTDLRITYEDGSVETVTTNTDWKTALSPVIFNSIYTGEHYDARLEQPGWNTPDFDEKGWKNAIAVGAPSENITAQVMHPIRVDVEVPVKAMTHPDNSTWIFDLGRNIAGVSSLTVSGETGTVIRLKHAERLDAKGRADQSNINVHYRPTDDTDPFQTDIYILSGKGEETFMPRFNYKGFQYVEVTSDKPLTLTKESLKGYFMHSAVPPAGKITSSNEILNKIWIAANNSYLSNLYGYPTDCPQREKNGWTGDAHIASETGLYNFDGITVYEKWLRDHIDEQQPNGVLPAIIPSDGWGYHWANGPDWTSTIAIIPWNIYLFYGDASLLGLCYDNIRRYVDHITDISHDGLTDWGLGDWIPIKSVASKELTSSIYYYVDATILAKAANLLGRQEDHAKYLALSERIRSAINKKYFSSENGIYAKGLQTELSAPLQWNVVPEGMRQKVADNLAIKIGKNDYRMDVGLLGTKAILNALSENNHADAAYRLAVRDSFPSWGWWIKNGATTLYENWPIDAGSDISLNHIMFGEVSAWMYKGLGGIFPDESKPGFKNILLKPNFVKGLDKFEAEHDGPYGKIVSSWKREGGKIKYRVVVPAGSTADLSLRKGAVSDNEMDANSRKFYTTEKDKDGNSILHLKSGTFLFTISE